jgi:predicted DNA-binding transcriptional regulator AlpA
MRQEENPMQPIQIDTLLTAKDLADLLCVSVSQLRYQVAKGELPRPVKLGTKMRRWKASVIQAYIDSLQAN